MGPPDGALTFTLHDGNDAAVAAKLAAFQKWVGPLEAQQAADRFDHLIGLFVTVAKRSTGGPPLAEPLRKELAETVDALWKRLGSPEMPKLCTTHGPDGPRPRKTSEALLELLGPLAEILAVAGDVPRALQVRREHLERSLAVYGWITSDDWSEMTGLYEQIQRPDAKRDDARFAADAILAHLKTQRLESQQLVDRTLGVHPQLFDDAGRRDEWTAYHTGLDRELDRRAERFLAEGLPLLEPSIKWRGRSRKEGDIADLSTDAVEKLAALLGVEFREQRWNGRESIAEKLEVARKDPARCRWHGRIHIRKGSPADEWVDFTAMSLPTQLVPEDWGTGEEEDAAERDVDGEHYFWWG